MSNSNLFTELLDQTAIQLSMNFWPGGIDPNQSSCDSFTIQSRELRSALQFLSLPSRCPDDLTVHVSKFDMLFHVTAQGGDTFASARICLVEPAEIHQDIYLVMSREVATRLASMLENTCTFHVNPERTEITLTQDSLNLAITTKPADSFPDTSPVNNAATPLDARELAQALAFATLLKRSYIPANHTGYHGARICNGVAMGGYQNAISSYSSPSIPKDLDFAIPHNTISNARHMLSHLASCVVGVDSDKVVFLNSDLGFECGWYTRSANWPSAMLAAFDNHEFYFRQTIDVERLASRALLHAIPSSKKIAVGHFRPADPASADPKLMLVSHYPHGTATSTVTDLHGEACDTEGLALTQYRMADIGKGGYALGMGKAEMAISQGAMLLTAQDQNATKKILFAAEIRR